MSSILVFGTPSKERISAIQKRTGAPVYHVEGPDDATLPQLLQSEADKIEILAVFTHGIDADLIGQFPNLRMIANYGVGYDGIDMRAATDRRIVVTNTPGVLDEDVADMAVLLLLATVRGLLPEDRLVRNDGWRKRQRSQLRPSVHRMTIGMLGLGNIGMAIARRLEAFGCTILYHTRHSKAVDYDYHSDLNAMARASDALIVIIPGGRETHHLVDAGVLEELGENGYLINVARGSVVDEPALIAALENGTIAGAGLDVFADEPNVPSSLRSADNVVLTPHIASATPFSRDAMADLLIENIQKFLQEGRVITPVRESMDYAQMAER
ncbi:2-hydroxyacid dehydrogenase [Notoacmeibacter ruber]|uniref:2-hydroxyacid dehydrogenase n=1 Tax=Notoacmeibacter ruber TaxID=2670375 RepID=A0A3L7JF64_9HYPH|nr:2-hydroxyacid dehydrogenase [Notoacmeibacter ruber]RLQ88231.1 2-hydroxyacid dehydrogenase [Notoacmeibacter ruber]